MIGHLHSFNTHINFIERGFYLQDHQFKSIEIEEALSIHNK